MSTTLARIIGPVNKGIIHLIGIGGTGMNGIARFLLQEGYQVSGSDTQKSPTVNELRKAGVKIYQSHQAGNITENCQLVIKSAAITPDNPEVRQSVKRGISILKYSEMLGLLMQTRYGIAVAGCHGKTTTSGLLTYALTLAQTNPSFVIGGYVKDLKTSARHNSGEYFVAEACEYDRSFHNLFYKIAIITNIEADHLDYYKNLPEIIQSFRTFASHTAPDGVIIANLDNKSVRSALAKIDHKVISFGLTSRADWNACRIKIKNGEWYFSTRYQGKPYGDFHLGLKGHHNIYNALAVIATCHFLGIRKSIIKKALVSFQGMERRFEYLGTINGASVIDDYGHHPTELQAVITTARQLYPAKKLWIVFQPHQAHRTKIFLKEFARVLSPVDRTIIPDIYFARDSERDKQRITSQKLVKHINRLGGNAIHLATFQQIISYLKKHLTKNDVVITIGAGDIWKVAKELVLPTFRVGIRNIVTNHKVKNRGQTLLTG